MKTLALATTALVGLTAAATAADLPRRMAPPPAPYVAVPVFTWTGAYFGVNAGYISQETTGTTFARSGAGVVNSTALALPQPFGAKVSPEGFIGGGQIGYNYQFGSVVAGIEADFQGTNARTSKSYNVSGTPLLNGVAGTPVTTYQIGENLGYLGTVRGRLGYSFDRVLVYATGGYAFASMRTQSNLAFPSGTTYLGATTKDREGYTVGGGVEYAVTDALSAKVEGLYYDLDKSRIAANRIPFNGSGNVYGINTKSDGFLVRGGLNYRFNTNLF